jgi:hypothetical protein
MATWDEILVPEEPPEGWTSAEAIHPIPGAVRSRIYRDQLGLRVYVWVTYQPARRRLWLAIGTLDEGRIVGRLDVERVMETFLRPYKGMGPVEVLSEDHGLHRFVADILGPVV